MRRYLLALICVWVTVGELAAINWSMRDQLPPKGGEGAIPYGRGKAMSEFERRSKVAELLDGPVPEEVDWRKVPNRVTAVKDQGKCNSSYAFAATGLLEGQQAMRNINGLIPLSAQQLISCSVMNKGCFSGLTMTALDDIAFWFGGIGSEADYPYEAKFGECGMDTSRFVMTARDFSHLDGEKALLKAIANYGPVAATIFATDNFMNYTSGVFDDPKCHRDSTFYANHNVLVVGYGTDAKEGDYWIVKNSMGTKWGEEGYIRMKRGVNMCAIASFPILVLF